MRFPTTSCICANVINEGPKWPFMDRELTAGIAIRMVLQISPMAAATEGAKRGGARLRLGRRDRRARMTLKFFRHLWHLWRG